MTRSWYNIHNTNQSSQTTWDSSEPVEHHILTYSIVIGSGVQLHRQYHLRFRTVRWACKKWSACDGCDHGCRQLRSVLIYTILWSTVTILWSLSYEDPVFPARLRSNVVGLWLFELQQCSNQRETVKIMIFCNRGYTVFAITLGNND